MAVNGIGRPSKFTKERREAILATLRVGNSRTTAAAIAGIGEGTLRRWLTEAKDAKAGSAKAQFLSDVLTAEAEPKVRAMVAVQDSWEARPDLAFKFLERRETGFAPPMPNAHPAAQTQTEIVVRFAPMPAVRAIANEAQASEAEAVVEAEIVEEPEAIG